MQSGVIRALRCSSQLVLCQLSGLGVGSDDRRSVRPALSAANLIDAYQLSRAPQARVREPAEPARGYLGGLVIGRDV